jgi:hypothetical protein
MQNSIFFEKYMINVFKHKEYKFPDGEISKIQGYENYALDLLIQEGYSYNDILTQKSDVPEIWYIENNIKRRYYCDIFIEKENKIIEVKSLYTFNISKDRNLLKKNACIEKGYNFEFMIFNKYGNKIENID